MPGLWHEIELSLYRGLNTMKRITFRTAGESHGRGLVALMEGLPAGLELIMERDVDPDLKRRQGGYGRGRRM